MKKVTLITFLLCGFVVIAQQSAKDLLDEVSDKASRYENITIDFKYALSNLEENINQETRGNVTLKKDKYKLKFLGVTRIFDGNILYSISDEDEEVTISSDNTEDNSLISPSKLLSFYKEGFISEIDIIQNVKGRKIQYIKLKPIDSNSEINYLLLGIDTNTKHIYNLIEIGKNGTKTTLTINSFKTNEPISKSLFTFDKSKYPDYFINNLD